MTGRRGGAWSALAMFLGLVCGLPAGAAEYLGDELCVECHEDQTNKLKSNPHGKFANSPGFLADQNCEGCHGPGSEHALQDGAPGTIASLKHGSDGQDVLNGLCLQCHQDGGRQHWQGAAHDAAGVVCTSCHLIHEKDPMRQRDGQAEACYQCHADIRAKAYRPYGHPLRHHQVVCSECHNSHGGTGPHELDAFSVNDNCYTCHAEKRGPFLYEHFPVAEDCTVCHDVHGSINRGSLNRRAPFLCIECHQEQAGGNHVRQVYDYQPTNDFVARGVLAQSCMNCHSQVHGTNHPSGRALMR